MISNFEASVVTHLLNNNEYNPDIQPKHFSNKNYSTIFEAARRLIADRKAADLFTVADYLGQEWSSRIADMMQGAIKPKEFYLDAMRESYKKRAVQEILADSEELEIGEILSKLFAIGEGKSNHTHSIKDAMKAAVYNLDKIHNGEIEPAIKTCIKRYDELNGGLHNSDLIIIGGRSGTGKTAFAINMLLASDKPSLFASSEQGAIQVAERMISVKGRVPLEKMRSASFNESEWVNIGSAVSQLVKRDISIFDYEKPTVADIEREARKLQIKHGLGSVAIDYVGRVKPSRVCNSKKEAMADIVSDCKSMAKRLDVPVILLSQLKRDSYARIPNETDLADATELENEADVIMLLHRRSTYCDEADPTEAELIIAKNRHGQTGLIPMTWHGPTLTYSNKEYSL